MTGRQSAAVQDPNDQATEALRIRLAEAEEMLSAIRQGEIDALVVECADNNRVYTLHSADEPYRNLVEQMEEGAAVISGRGDILYANARLGALLGQPLESVVGSRVERFLHPSDRDEFDVLIAAGSGRRRSRLIARDSRTVDVSLSLTTTVATNGRRLNLIVTDLGELLEAATKRDRAERDSRTKDEFLAMLAHELRNPLGAISNAISVLKSTNPDGADGTGAHAVIARQVSHISRLIDDLLDVERVVSGKIRLNRQPIDMADATRRAVAAFTSDPHLDRHIDITTEPVWVDADAVRLEQILTNVLANAVKYTESGGSIRVSLRADGDEAVLVVKDDGLGISPALLPFIFDLYVQADRTLGRSRGGLGIGLALVRRLIVQHGGTIGAFSNGEGHGSTFTVRLRRIPPVREHQVFAQRDRRATPRRVLLIEDNADARQMLRMMLELAGHVVYDTGDGIRALELVDTVRPDVVIIDIGLPIVDGYQIAKRIRDDPHGRGMLLVALTGSGQPPPGEHGFDHHLIKPVDPDLLARLLVTQIPA